MCSRRDRDERDRAFPQRETPLGERDFLSRRPKGCGDLGGPSTRLLSACLVHPRQRGLTPVSRNGSPSHPAAARSLRSATGRPRYRTPHVRQVVAPYFPTTSWRVRTKPRRHGSVARRASSPSRRPPTQCTMDCCKAAGLRVLSRRPFNQKCGTIRVCRRFRSPTIIEITLAEFASISA